MNIILEKDVFEYKFKSVLEEKSVLGEEDWQKVDIESIDYHSTLLTDLPMTLDGYVVRMRVVKPELPQLSSADDIRDWIRYHKFIYAIMSKNVRADSEEPDMLTLDLGTTESIAVKICKAFGYVF